MKKYILLALSILSLSACYHHANNEVMKNNFVNTHITNFQVDSATTNEKLTLPLSDVKDLHEIKDTILAKSKIEKITVSCKNLKSKKCISAVRDIEIVLGHKPIYKNVEKDVMHIYYSSTIKKSPRCMLSDFHCSYLFNLDTMLNH